MWNFIDNGLGDGIPLVSMAHITHIRKSIESQRIFCNPHIRVTVCQIPKRLTFGHIYDII